MDVKKLLGDRRVQIGAIGTVAAAGGYTWYRHRNSAAANTAPAASDGSGGTTPTAYEPGTFPDTSGTDTAAWLGQNEASFMDELNAWFASHTAGTPAPSTPSPVTLPIPKPKVPPAKGGGPIKRPPETVTVVKYAKGQQAGTPSTLSGIVTWAKNRGVNVTTKQLQSLNGLGSSTVVHPGQEIKL
jgi:hypothetical protein